MTEVDAIKLTDEPVTVESLVQDLVALGVAPGMTLMVHTSMSRLGFVVGGAQAVVHALLAAVGDDGTVMMPTHSGGLSDPSSWSNPPVPKEWWPTIREQMPAYDPQLTPTRQMGAVAECFLRFSDVQRSDHPTMSAAAIGPNAQALTEGHLLPHGLGETSPQARLYDLDGHILLLGVDHGNNTSLHVSEYRAAGPDTELLTYYSPITVDGERVWQPFESMADDDSDFARLGEDFAKTDAETSGPAGAGAARLMRSRDIVDFGVEWMKVHRQTSERAPTDST